MKTTVHNKKKKAKSDKIAFNYLLFILTALALIGILSSCGPQQVDVTGTVTHKIELDLSGIEKYFKVICEQEQPDNIEVCTSEMVTNFLSYVL
jgi:hypothetical protein